MAASDYRNLHVPFENMGLNTVNPSDRVPEGQWTILNNVRNTQEELLTTRTGTETFVTGVASGPVLSLRRIDNLTLLIQAGGSVYRNATLISTGWSATQAAAIVRYRPPFASDNWAFVTDGTTTAKIRSDGTQYAWGITRPSIPVSFSTSGTGDLDSSVAGASDYDYRYTYYSSITGSESNPSTIQTSIAVVNQGVSATTYPSADTQVTNIRLYRRGGTIPTTWKLVTTLTNTLSVYTDTASDLSLEDAANLSEENDVPFTTTDTSGNTLFGAVLPNIFGPFIGRYILAVGDVNRPNFVYWTNPEQPDNASAFNNLQVCGSSESLINGFIYGSNPYIWTRDNLYTLDYGGPNALPTFQPRLLPIGIGLAARNGFTANGPGGVFFLGKDGIYVTDCLNSVENISLDIRPLFRGLTVGNFKPIDFSDEEAIHMEYIGMELHFVYNDTDGDVQHIFYDILKKRWQTFSFLNLTQSVPYGDENQPGYRLFLGSSDGDVLSANVPNVTTDADSTSVQGAARTGSITADIPLTIKEFGNVIIDIDTQGNEVQFTPYYNAEADAGTTTTITTATRERVSISLEDFYAYNLALDFTWQGPVTLYAAEILFRVDEENLKHWEQPPTNLGIPGWKHLRDGYLALRSNDTVVLTVSVDGVDYSYSLASTGGARRMVYVRLSPVKGRIFQFKLDSDANFRHYTEETQFNAKPWNTQQGYTPIFPFPAAGVAPFLRKGSGT